MDFMSTGQLGAYNNDYPVPVEKLGRSIPVREQIQRERDMHTQEMKRLDAMLKLIEENPAIEQFINLQRGYIG